MKTGLVLSGGGSRGAYEAGVWQALTELGIKIDIVTGASVGAINGAMVCQGNLEKTISLWKEIETHMVFDVPEGSQPIEYAKEIVLNQGARASGLKELLETYIDEDKILNSPVEYGITAVSIPEFTGHHLFKEDMPKGTMIDYIMASASAFPAIHSYEINGKEFIDGGYTDVMPVSMALKKGATHIVAVNLKGPGIIDHKSLKAAPNLVLIEPHWDLGNVLIFDTNNARRIMRLGYLDAMKAYGLFDGKHYTFAKGAFDRTNLELANACGKVFEMDPTLIYTKTQFLRLLSSFIEKYKHEAESSFKKHTREPFFFLEQKDSWHVLKKDIKNVANEGVLTLTIAYQMKDRKQSIPLDLFKTKASRKLLPDNLLAAEFLIRNGLV